MNIMSSFQRISVYIYQNVLHIEHQGRSQDLGEGANFLFPDLEILRTIEQ